MTKAKNRNKRIIYLGLLALAAIVVIFSFVPQRTGIINHKSEDLKISLDYPKGWYVDDRYHSILLTDYKTNQNRNDVSTSDQIEISIDNFSGCHPTIEENLKDPACGEGGPFIKLNSIVSKEVKEVVGGTLYKYIVESSTSGSQFIYYLLENGDRVLQISKKPDPSQHEKEFEEIIDSIRFL